jgi:hypothetical protein
MSDHKHVNLQAECLNLQNIIADLIHLKGTGLTPTEANALYQARRWLGDITLPLTPKEQEQWEEESSTYIEEFIRDADAWCYNDMMNDADRRDALEYLEDTK